MIKFFARGRCAQAMADNPVTTGSVGISVQFFFSQEWDALQKIAVFRAGDTAVDVALTGDTTIVPADVLTTAGLPLMIGVYGAAADGTVVIPTVWAKAATIKAGTAPSGVDPSEPTPSWVAQVQQIAAEALETAEAVQTAAERGDFDGADGVSPEVTITTITGGHRVTITDAEHPGGQSFDVMDGTGGGGASAASDLDSAFKDALLQIAQKVAYIDGQGQTYYQALYDTLYPPAALVSISAVFNQGSAVIYDTASLDDLKQYLTVTATYDDSTSAVVTDYTLSGTLTAGTSTVTVSYGGKTTTFTVNVTTAPTISSISAVYTQSGTVYDTDTLDSLKADLVVTAHYSDSSSGTVPAADYTLSGTLTVGTSTITASYGGKTDTFSVTVTKGITYLHNWDFTQSLVDSVTSGHATLNGKLSGHEPQRDSNGVAITEGSQWIDLGSIYAPGTTVEIDFGAMSRQGTANGRLLMIGTESSGGLGTGFIYRSTGVWNWYAAGAWDTATSISDADYFSNKTLKAVFDSTGHMSVYADGVLVGTSTKVFATSAGTIMQIGANPGTGTYTSYYNMVVKAVRIYENEV